VTAFPSAKPGRLSVGLSIGWFGHNVGVVLLLLLAIYIGKRVLWKPVSTVGSIAICFRRIGVFRDPAAPLFAFGMPLVTALLGPIIVAALAHE